ncbi:NAD(P)-dependent oxidoreductase [Mycolicibacterium sp.]|uniref:NAD(P)-dependent oxidoreductase n=1 Tax=Mycolicibacterium sp. TaxID=2320850 RepID=UPI0037C8A5B2
MSAATVLGTGMMGSAMARCLARAGHQVTVWNRTVGNAMHLADVGVAIEPDLGRAVVANPVVISVVTGYDALHRILDQVEIRDRVLINFTTGTPTDATELEARVAESGGRLLEGAVICYPKHLGTPRAFVVVAGSRDTWQQQEDMLRSVDAQCRYLGAAAQMPNVVDAAQLGFYIPALGAAMEAVAYAQTKGVALSQLRPVLSHGMRVLDEFLAVRENSIGEGDFTVSDSPAAVYAAAAAGVVVSMAEAGIDSRIARAVSKHLDEVVKTGRGSEDVSLLAAVLLDAAKQDTSNSVGLPS